MLIHSNTEQRFQTSSKLNTPISTRFRPINGPTNNEEFRRFLSNKIEEAKFGKPIPAEPNQPQQQREAKRINNGKSLSLPQVVKLPSEASNKKMSTRPVDLKSTLRGVNLVEQQPPLPVNPFDMLWNSTYLTKYNINDYIEENKALKAKVWNYEKENRKMHRQLEQWGLDDQIDSEAKPFVDSSTLQKVYKDSQYLTVTKKQVVAWCYEQQMFGLQAILKEREDELKSIEGQIEKQKKDATIMEDFEKDSIKEFYVVLHKAQVRQANRDEEEVQYRKLLELEEKKSNLKSQIQQLADINNVYSFEVEVQQNMFKKLVREASTLEKRVETLDLHIDKLEEQVKDKQPSTLNQLQQNQKSRQKKKAQVIGKIEKTSDEILRDKIALIDEQKKKVEQLNFQIQEMTRTCIMEKQDLLKDITDTKVELRDYSNKILSLRLNIFKFDQFDQSVSSDISNQRGDSVITQYSH